MPTDLIALAERVEGLQGPDREVDELCALAFRWRRRLVTGLGMNGRTPGSWLWFPPCAPYGAKGSRNPPRFTGPRKRASTVIALRTLATTPIQEDPTNGR